MNKATELYVGDFLPDELYCSCIESKRQEAQAEYIDLLQKMAEYHVQRGASKSAIECYKKLFRANPLSDHACQKLMSIYSNRGMHSAALKVYEDCRSALRKELDAEPDELTQALYRKILSEKRLT